MYWIKRKYQQIKRVIDFLPTIWNGYDFDYHYSLELFKKQLERQAKFMESDRAMTLDAKTNAQKIRTAIRLMDKVYEEEYGMEYMETVDNLYGKTHFDFIELEEKSKKRGEPLYELKLRNEKAVDEEHQKEIDEIRREMAKLSKERQKRAHKLLWEFIEWNIQSWWD